MGNNDEQNYQYYGYDDDNVEVSVTKKNARRWFWWTFFLCAAIAALQVSILRRRRKKRKNAAAVEAANNGTVAALPNKSAGEENVPSTAKKQSVHAHYEQMDATDAEHRDQAEQLWEWDLETQRIANLAGPFMIKSVANSIMDVLTAVIIGRLIGTQALTVYTVVWIPVTLTESLIGSVLEALSTLCSQAVGSGSFKLTGQYCQISLILYTILYIPHAIGWSFGLRPTLEWIGLEDDAVEDGMKYFSIMIVYGYLEGVSSILTRLLEIISRQDYAIKSGLAHSVVALVGIFVHASFSRNPSIQSVGGIWLFLRVVWLCFDSLYVAKKRWISDFSSGMFHSVAISKWQSVMTVLKTAIPLSGGHLLVSIEWEIFGILAACIGPAEASAWALTGTLWAVLENITYSISEAGEIRVATLLGEGHPRMAKLSSYKILTMASIVTIPFSVAFFCLRDVLPWCLTRDPELQQLMECVFGLVALGNMSLTLGSVSWTLVGAQGRYPRATFHGFLGSAVAAIPYGCIAVLGFNQSLPALVSAIVFGYMVSGTLNTLTLLLSDWRRISYKVMQRNGVIEGVADDYSENDFDDNKSSASTDTSVGSGSIAVSTEGVSIVTGLDFEHLDDGSTKSSEEHEGEETDLHDDEDDSDDSKYGELRTILLSAGEVTLPVQLTDLGPTLIDLPQEDSLFDVMYPGDIIVAIDEVNTLSMGSIEINILLREKSSRERRVTVWHRNGRGLRHIYCTGALGSGMPLTTRDKGETWKIFLSDIFRFGR